MEGLQERKGKFGELIDEGRRESCSSSDFGINGEQSHSSSSEESSSITLSPSWPCPTPKCVQKAGLGSDGKIEVHCSLLMPEMMEMMKERFAKLLLGEDMSGCGNGVSTALAISNAITNLCATLFGQIWRLEPMAAEKKAMWRREIEWLLCIADHIVELTPTWQTFADGSKLEIMTCRPRPDLYVNLPALRKLDNMLIGVLDSFQNEGFWYVDQGIVTSEADGSASRRQFQRQGEKWWLPVPRVPPGGLREDIRKELQHKRDCTNQILKAAMAINSTTLGDMEVPVSYLDNLPKNGRASLGDLLYRYITSDQFSPECLLDCMDLSSEHQAIEIANRLEASIYIWRQKVNSKPSNNSRRSSSKSSWDIVKDLMVDVEKRELLADRAESLLFCLKQQFPGLPQTALDMSKIQHNKDVGKSILESYSRVLESLAFNIIARIDDLLYVDDLTKHSDQLPSISKVSVISHKTVTIPYSIPVSGTQYKKGFTTSFLTGKVERERSHSPLMSPFLSSSSKVMSHGVGIKVSIDYLNVHDRIIEPEGCNTGSDAISYTTAEATAALAETTPFERENVPDKSLSDDSTA